MAIVGIGTEIVECVRIAKMIETHGDQFLARVYSPGEIETCLAHPNATQRFATRWAAKESVIKAMRCHRQGIRWAEIEIDGGGPGRDGPAVVLSGKAAWWANRSGIVSFHLSLAACRTHATAYVIAVDE